MCLGQITLAEKVQTIRPIFKKMPWVRSSVSTGVGSGVTQVLIGIPDQPHGTHASIKTKFSKKRILAADFTLFLQTATDA